jgi:hypothetical protein
MYKFWKILNQFKIRAFIICPQEYCLTHLNIIFHAPKFDSAGTKVKNAWFEEVTLNGAVVHRNVELSGPTRASLETKEEPKAPLLFQGDEGLVAFKNLKYKLFEDRKVEWIDVRLKE